MRVHTLSPPLAPLIFLDVGWLAAPSSAMGNTTFVRPSLPKLKTLQILQLRPVTGRRHLQDWYSDAS